MSRLDYHNWQEASDDLSSIDEYRIDATMPRYVGIDWGIDVDRSPVVGKTGKTRNEKQRARNRVARQSRKINRRK